MVVRDVTERSEEEIATELVHRIRGGDRAAEGELVQRYSRGLLLMLRRLTGDPVLAEDIHQDTFRIVLVRLRETDLDEPAKIAGFLRRTARNLFIGEYRKQGRRQTDGDPEALEAAVAPTPSQLTNVLQEEESRLVRRVIGELKTERDRQVLLRFYLAEDDKDQICADLGLDSLHFNRVLFRARQRFKKLLEGAAGEHLATGTG
jgi:RNA polymerase sigma-70 factor (ECF subfamily)